MTNDAIKRRSVSKEFLEFYGRLCENAHPCDACHWLAEKGKSIDCRYTSSLVSHPSGFSFARSLLSSFFYEHNETIVTALYAMQTRALRALRRSPHRLSRLV
jgi:hypothetical protein